MDAAFLGGVESVCVRDLLIVGQQVGKVPFEKGDDAGLSGTWVWLVLR